VTFPAINCTGIDTQESQQQDNNTNTHTKTNRNSNRMDLVKNVKNTKPQA